VLCRRCLRCPRVLDFLDAEGIAEVVLFLTHSDRDHTSGAEQCWWRWKRTSIPHASWPLLSRDRINVTRRGEYRRLVQFIGRSERRLSKRDPRNPSADSIRCSIRCPRLRLCLNPCASTWLIPRRKTGQSDRRGTNETPGCCLSSTRGGWRRAPCLAHSGRSTDGMSLMLDREQRLSLHADVLKYPHTARGRRSGRAREIGTPVQRQTWRISSAV